MLKYIKNMVLVIVSISFLSAGTPYVKELKYNGDKSLVFNVGSLVRTIEISTMGKNEVRVIASKWSIADEHVDKIKWLELGTKNTTELDLENPKAIFYVDGKLIAQEEHQLTIFDSLTKKIIGNMENPFSSQEKIHFQLLK